MSLKQLLNRILIVCLLLSLSVAFVACTDEPSQPAAGTEAVQPPAAGGGAFAGTLEKIVADFLVFLPKLLSSLVMFVITLYLANLLSRLVRRVMEKRNAEPGLTLLFFMVSRWGIIIIGTAVALRQVDFELTTFLAGLGILGFTIGFALQDISQNVIAGLLLLIQKPFELGDLIEVADFRGRVLSVDLRSTELRTLDGHNVLIPNASVFTTPIINYSRQATWRVGITVGVAYDSDLEAVRTTTINAVRRIPDVLDDPEPDLFFHTFNDSAIDFTVRYWIDARLTNPFTATDPAIVAIQRAFARAGIEIPYPIQTEIQLAPEPQKVHQSEEG